MRPKLRKMIIGHAPDHVLMAICECALSVLKETIVALQDTSPWIGQQKSLQKAKEAIPYAERWRIAYHCFTSCYKHSWKLTCLNMAKRMALVPEEVFNRLERKQRLETSSLFIAGAVQI